MQTVNTLKFINDSRLLIKQKNFQPNERKRLKVAILKFFKKWIFHCAKGKWGWSIDVIRKTKEDHKRNNDLRGKEEPKNVRDENKNGMKQSGTWGQNAVIGNVFWKDAWVSMKVFFLNPDKNCQKLNQCQRIARALNRLRRTGFWRFMYQKILNVANHHFIDFIRKM